MATGEVDKLSKSGRGFHLVMNDLTWYDLVRDYLKSLKALDYLLVTSENAPKTGKHHYHIYAHFKVPTKLSMKALHGAHIETCYASPQKNIAYITKDGAEVIEEFGERPHKGGYSIKEVRQMSKEERENLPMMYYNVVKKIEADESKTVKIGDWHKEVNVSYIEGPSGLGKSKLAEKLLEHEGYKEFNPVSYKNGFWSGVSESCEACIYDDWRSSDMDPREFISFIDYNKHYMNVKGGMILNNYKRIIITTIEELDTIYSGTLHVEPKEQWIRRINKHYILKDKFNMVELDK